jgi:hypothetical protein
VIPHNIALVLIIGGPLALAVFILGPALACYLIDRHKWSPWYETGSMFWDLRHCRRCARVQERETEWWSEVTSPQPSMSPTVEPATEPLASYGTGTNAIPRLSNGALASTPTPPRVAGPGHVVLDHEL